MTDLVTLDVRRELPSTTIVMAIGEIDLSNVRQLETVLERVHDGDRLVVDLTQCTFFDSSCLAVLARRARALRDEGRQFSVRVGEHGRQIISITNLGKLLDVDSVASPDADHR